ncbi:uncharacterized protein EDB93DRAFT_1252239 [Suillus bovinus]|uniref:uncharacterized protein n=1 Tax=Suillus bovinus TaxID=48563 RepID=UPI001B85BDC9|nr:uncharacterized protein EDB93DRAFT_1252239 [Suillus bovinus]KAG2142774.1 hypothetical protein EDB93DRAFT_1252239 [Suillus bovinus]
MPLKYKNEQQCHNARLESKRRCYERHKLDERLKSRTHWRKHLGATVATQHFIARLDLIWLNLGYQPGHSQYTVLQSQGLTLVHKVDDEGWQVVRPTYECIVAEAQELLSEAREVLAGALHAEAAVDIVELHCDAWDKALSLMDDSADMYFEALMSDQLLKQDWCINDQHQKAQSHVAEERRLYHKHSCFTRTFSGKVASETEFFIAEHEPSLVVSHPPSGVDITMEDFGFDSHTHTDTELIDYDMVDPAYENFLKESTVGPKKCLRSTGDRTMALWLHERDVAMVAALGSKPHISILMSTPKTYAHMSEPLRIGSGASDLRTSHRPIALRAHLSIPCPVHPN